ncbi:hypothetical protein VKT23_014725 [Stygiomarasmius scandens]|uniref:F-box domain-containing protein n=1 Tax=Marasmiellus scandens TaxID=2682957 RepID=A0ABR1J250_9AGAR
MLASRQWYMTLSDVFLEETSRRQLAAGPTLSKRLFDSMNPPQSVFSYIKTEWVQDVDQIPAVLPVDISFCSGSHHCVLTMSMHESRRPQMDGSLASNDSSRPFNLIPNELLSEIFTIFCLFPPEPRKPSESGWIFSNAGEFLETRDVTHLPQNTITAVCSHWRQVALRTPQLWQDLRIHFQNGRFTDHAPLTAAWLARSGSCPLTINIRSGCLPDSYQLLNTGAESVVTLAALRATQWYELNLCQPFEFFHPIFTLPRPSLPYLRKVDLRFSENRTHETFPHVEAFDFLMNAPRLEVVVLTGHIDNVPILDRLRLPGSQITNLTIYNLFSNVKWGPEFVSDILHSFPALQYVNLFVLSGPQSPLPTPLPNKAAITTLPNLRELTLVTDCNTGLDYILANLSLPNLRYLNLNHTPELTFTRADAKFPKTFLRLLYNSRFALRVLKLVNIDALSSYVLEEFLAGVNASLEELEVFYCQGLDLIGLVERFETGFEKGRKSFLDEKIELPEISLVLPNLTNLSLGASFEGQRQGDADGDADGIATWTIQRMNPPAVPECDIGGYIGGLNSAVELSGSEDVNMKREHEHEVAVLKHAYFQFNAAALTEEKKVVIQDAKDKARLNIDLDLLDDVWGDETDDDEDDEDETDSDSDYD